MTAEMIDKTLRERRLEKALREMIYESTSLSPMQNDGSHWCRISRETLEMARDAIKNDPHTLEDKLEEARNSVVKAAGRLSRCAYEFDGNLATCCEYFDALWDAFDRMEAIEKELADQLVQPRRDDQ